MMRSNIRFTSAATTLSSICAVMTVIAVFAAEPDVPADGSVVVRGINGKPKSFSFDELKRLPSVEVDEVSRKGDPVKYKGVEVFVLLKEVGTAHGETLRGEWMRAFVTVDARDEYRAVFSLTEFDADFTDRKIILAYERNGEPLDKQTGPLQIIVPGEKKHARWVRMVKEIRVLDSSWIKD
jgi:hypothetical protein